MITSANLDFKRAKLLDPTLGKRVFNNAVKESLHDMASEWHDEMLPEHFTEAGAQKYGYYRRKGQGLDRSGKAFQRSYTAKKLRMFGHEKPLVFTGEGQQLARLRRIRATSKQATVVLPSKFNFRHAKSRINMREELTAITQGEIDTLRGLAERRCAEILQTGKES